MIYQKCRSKSSKQEYRLIFASPYLALSHQYDAVVFTQIAKGAPWGIHHHVSFKTFHVFISFNHEKSSTVNVRSRISSSGNWENDWSC